MATSPRKKTKAKPAQPKVSLEEVRRLQETVESLLHELHYRDLERLRSEGRQHVIDPRLITARWIKSSTDGWIVVLTSAGKLSLPSALAVDLQKNQNGRDYFRILEGINKGIEANVVAGNLVSTDPTFGPIEGRFAKRAQGPVVIDGKTYDRELRLRRDDQDYGPFPALTKSDNPVPQGTHVLQLPDYPHELGSQYGTLATVWFRIGTSGDRYVHPGRVSDGCVTCAPSKWPQICAVLQTARQGDQANVGTLKVT